MIIKDIKDEDFANYKKPSMFVIMPHCSFKCDKENGCNLCQNSHLAQEPDRKYTTDGMIVRYLTNPLTKAIVFGGLEPFDSAEELDYFIYLLRNRYYCKDDVVIYTGYTEEELDSNPYFQSIIQNGNVVIKFGRFRPDRQPYYNEVLGVKLASDNQHARRY